MGKVSTYKRGIAAFISSEKGQRFFNFAYSIGAAIVIWGALFKILHLPGGNALLSIGMGTEVLMFVLTAFDRPPKEYKWEEVFPVLDSGKEEDRPDFAAGGSGVIISGGSGSLTAADADYARSAAGLPAGIELSEADSLSLSESISKMAAAADQLSRMAELTSATQQYLDQMSSIAAEMEALRQNTAALNQVSALLLTSMESISGRSQQITDSASGYADQMQALSQNLGGLNTIYEIQLRSVSSQVESIDRVNRGIKDIRDMYEKSAQQSVRYCEETEKMARYMQQLNAVYEKMLHAMTVNMYNPMAATAAGQQPQ